MRPKYGAKRRLCASLTDESGLPCTCLDHLGGAHAEGTGNVGGPGGAAAPPEGGALPPPGRRPAPPRNGRPPPAASSPPGSHQERNTDESEWPSSPAPAT